MDLVVCSLEAWDEVWRRNQFLVDALLRRDPALRVLFVEPPHDLVLGLRHRKRVRWPKARPVGDSGRLWSYRPIKPLPRAAGPWADRALIAQVRAAARQVGFTSPVAWVNDLTYGPIGAVTGWPILYDVTDDWLLESAPPRELARRRRLDALLLEVAAEVVVCSPALAVTRGSSRPVTLIPNGVDEAHFQASQPRPSDLPPGPVAVYVGTLQEERIDVELVSELAIRPAAPSVVLVGPDSLSSASRRTLDAAGVVRLGARPYAAVPAYLQHADVVIVPHQVTPFTESLDPIKAYECMAVGRPTVATEVAGFRHLGEPVRAVARSRFVDEVVSAAGVRRERPAVPHRGNVAGWEARCGDFADALARARGPRRQEIETTADPPNGADAG